MIQVPFFGLHYDSIRLHQENPNYLLDIVSPSTAIPIWNHYQKVEIGIIVEKHFHWKFIASSETTVVRGSAFSVKSPQVSCNLEDIQVDILKFLKSVQKWGVLGFYTLEYRILGDQKVLYFIEPKISLCLRRMIMTTEISKARLDEKTLGWTYAPHDINFTIHQAHRVAVVDKPDMFRRFSRHTAGHERVCLCIDDLQHSILEHMSIDAARSILGQRAILFDTWVFSIHVEMLGYFDARL